VSDLPSGWARIHLESLVAFSIGGVWGSSPDDISPDTTTVAVMRGADYRHWATSRAASAAIRRVSTKAVESRCLNAGDLVIEVSGGGPTQPVGRVVLIDRTALQSVRHPLLLSNFCRRVVLSKQVNPQFIYYQLLHSYLCGGTGRYQTATTNIRNLNFKKYLAGAELAIAPYAEQERIVAVIEEQFSRLDAAQSGLTQIKDKLRRLRSALLIDALSGDWPKVRLGDVADVDSGPAFQSKFFRGPSEGIRLLRGDNIEPGGLRWTNERTWPSHMLDGYENLFVCESDLILGMDRPIISTGLKLASVKQSDLPALLVQRVARIRSSEAVLTPFLHLALQLPRFIPHLLGSQTGTQLPHITLAGIRSFTVPLPSVDEQEHIAVALDRQLSILDALETETTRGLKRSSALRLAVLATAFAGKLVPQDQNHEPASVLLERIEAERASSNGHKPTLVRGGRRRKATA
jgi:type I restriction enzyme, S subunit